MLQLKDKVNSHLIVNGVQTQNSQSHPQRTRPLFPVQHLLNRQKRNDRRTSQSHQRVLPSLARQQTRFGGDFELSEEKKKILQQAEEYLDSHAGYKYLSRMRT